MVLRLQAVSAAIGGLFCWAVVAVALLRAVCSLLLAVLDDWPEICVAASCEAMVVIVESVVRISVIIWYVIRSW